MNYIKKIALVSSLAVVFVGCGDETAKSEAPAPAKVEEAKQPTVEQQVAEVGKSMQEAAKQIEANPDMSKEEQQKVMMEALSNSEPMKNQFELQKENMPKMVNLLKSTRECLGDADSKSDADDCQTKMETTLKEMGIVDEELDESEEEFTWTKEEKAETLKEMDESIKEMEKALPCIEKSKNMMDMMVCMEGERKY
ncbi:MAG: hypothetical protein K0U38_11090 [Epsilonproteobacteria bacterium]|nr:hypothetical protein [Campylobacterota bacterium]